MDDISEEELPEGFRVTEGPDDIEPVEDEVLVEDTYTTDPNTALFDNAFGTGQTVFPEGDEDAKEFLDIFSQQYEDR